MGVVHGNATYLSFSVTGRLENLTPETMERAIEARRFAPLATRGDEMLSSGWASLEAPFDDSTPVLRHDFLFGDTIALAYREDKIALPKDLVNYRVKSRLSELELQGEKITRQVKQTVKAMVVSELRLRVLPKPRVVDVVWDQSRERVRIFATGTIAKERVATLFERTFDARLHPLDYTRRAATLDLSKRAQHILENLSPLPLYAGVVRDD